MKRIAIEYHETFEPGLLTEWLAMTADDSATDSAAAHGASRLAGIGYPQLVVELDGFVFRFASLAELDLCITTLACKLLPSTRTETLRRGLVKGTHWLDHMPAWTKPWRYRQRAVRLLECARANNCP